MAHKTLIDSTEREIVGGKTLIDGTEREIVGGKTLINGTEYEIVITVECTITITAEANSGTYANIKIGEEQYSAGWSSEHWETNVPKGTIITCYVLGGVSTGVKDSGTGRIIINDEEVVTSYNGGTTYDYIVKGNATIDMVTERGNSTLKGGVITIAEE